MIVFAIIFIDFDEIKIAKFYFLGEVFKFKKKLQSIGVSFLAFNSQNSICEQFHLKFSISKIIVKLLSINFHFVFIVYK